MSDGRHVVFAAGGQRFALPLEDVREVVPAAPPFARVPRCGPEVKGGMNLRGRVVAVVDLAALLRLPPAAPGEPAHVVILEAERRALGLLVGAVHGVEPLAPDEEGAADAPAGAGAGLVRGVARAGGRSVALLDVATLESQVKALFGAGSARPG